MSQSHLGEQLLAYLDGELSPEEARKVEAHVAQCPHCAAELAELRALGQGLGQTLDTALSRVRLSREADDRIRAVLRERLERRERAGWLWRIWGRRMQVAQAALAIILLAFSFDTYRVLSLPAPAAAQEVLVFGESRLAPGSQGALRVIVRTVDAARAERGGSAPAGSALGAAISPVAGARVFISLLTESGVPAPLYEGETDHLGTVNAAFTVPEIPEGQADLVIETSSAVGEERFERSVEIARAYKIYVMVDKPAYRPGQVFRMRALVLDSTTLRPVSGDTLQWRVTGASGETLCRDALSLSDYGVSTWQCALPPEADEGTYVLSAALGDTTTERAVRVEDYDLPAFRVAATPDRSYYAPGDSLAVRVDAAYFFGMPVGGGDVVLRVYEQTTEGRLVAESHGVTDAQGHAELKVDLPSDLDDGQLVLEAQSVDSVGQVAGIGQVVPVNRAPMLVRAMPESGVLKPGVENDVFLIATTPDGRPAVAELAVTLDGERYELWTDAFGLAVLQLVPSGDTELVVEARDADGNAVATVLDLRTDAATQALLLHTAKAIYEVGETLQATALVPGDSAGPVYLDVVQDDRMVATLSAPVEDGAATFALDLAPDFAGALELRATTLPAEGGPLQDTRLIVVDPPRALGVTINEDRERYVPGDVAHLVIETTSGVGAGPVPAVLGVSVVDVSVYALDSLPAGFARAYILINEEMLARRDQVGGVELPSLLDGLDGAQAAQDLVAQAAWAGAPVADASLRAQAVLTPVDAAATARHRLAGWLHGFLALLPVVLVAIVVQYLRRTSLLSATLRRVAIALGVLILLAPVLIAGLVVGWLLPVLGAVLFFIALGVALVLLGILSAYGWRRKRAHVRLFAALVFAYLMLAGLTLGLASSGAEPGGGTLILLVATFLLLILATLFEGQAMLVERVLGVGWSTTALALVLVILAVTAPTVPALRSDLAKAVGSPALYVGPLGWLSGCGVASEAPMTAEAEAAEESTQATSPAAPTATPLSTPAPEATAPVEPTLPAEPYPLRHIFPETLYWDPDAKTDAQGRLLLDLPLADSLTTWQVTALASTLDGAIGAASVPLVVSQDLVLDVDSPDEATVGEAITLTLSVYNTSDVAELVTWELPDDEGFVTLEAPASSPVPAKSGAGATWIIRPDRAGSLALEIAARGERSGDRVLVELEVVR